MPIRPINAEVGAPRERGSTVVCILASGGDEQAVVHERIRRTVLSVSAHTDRSIPVLIAGRLAGVDPIGGALSAQPDERTWLTLEPGALGTATAAFNRAAGATLASDIVLLAAGVQVTASWLERLTAAARSDSIIATATPLSLAGDGLALLADGQGDRLDPPDLDALAQRLSERALRLRPRIAAAGPGCAYLRRPALDLLGPLDERLSLHAALDEFSVRAIAAGMVHVAADDVLVAGAEAASLRAQPSQLSDRLAAGVRETVVDDEHGRLRRAMLLGRTAARPISVTIDGRSLVAAVGGTQTYVLDLILALAREPRITLRVLVPPDLSERAATAIARFPDVQTLTYERALEGAPLNEIVHRPQPAFTADDLTLLQLLGERVVIGQQDLIAYHNHSYHRDIDAWRGYRRTTRLALAAADQVIFFSEHARGDALAEDLLPEGRTHVVGAGAEAPEGAGSELSRPQDIRAEEPFLLCLGADYEHKNRPFAIKLLGGLRELGWDGRLVLAGPHVPHGSSSAREAELLSQGSALAQFVVDLGPVQERHKQWLLRNARALVYPTLYEGLGLVPLEAARAGVPCLFASQASLSELAGEAATLIPWDAVASAAAVLPLLTDGEARARHVAELRSLSVPDWGEVAGQIVAVYEQALRAPPSEAASRSWQELDREAYVGRLERDIEHLKNVAQEHQDAYHELEQRVAPGLPLIDRDGLLSPAEQRGLMRVASRRGLRALALGPFGLLGRLRSSPDPRSD